MVPGYWTPPHYMQLNALSVYVTVMVCEKWGWLRWPVQFEADLRPYDLVGRLKALFRSCPLDFFVIDGQRRVGVSDVTISLPQIEQMIDMARGDDL